MSPRGRRGFSLIELFVVLVVIGILVGLSIPRLHQFKHQFYLTTMISDLRNLAATEEGYWSTGDSYSSDFSALRFNVSQGVWVTFVQADSLGWSATATHENDTSTCAIYYGNAPPVAPATVKNYIGCSK
ncbi:MAG TPA: prepilin-type N-terminal cleavage/methylation domain-containing protein [Gemmatimonadaceae bacterium]